MERSVFVCVCLHMYVDVCMYMYMHRCMYFHVHLYIQIEHILCRYILHLFMSSLYLSVYTYLGCECGCCAQAEEIVLHPGCKGQHNSSDLIVSPSAK